MSEDEATLNEIKNYKPAPLQLNNRIDVLLKMLERKPPTYKAYPALGFSAAVVIGAGYFSLAAGLIGFLVALFLPIDLTSGLIGMEAILIKSLSAFGSCLVFISGISLVANGETLRLFMDLQENADRQSIALHGIFHLLLMEQKKGNQS